MRVPRAAALLAVVSLAGCAHSGPPEARPIVPQPVPMPAGIPARVEALVAELGHDAVEQRDRAGRTLRELGSDPAHQVHVVEALRAASTRPDGEVRGRARDILRGLERSESLAPGYFGKGPMVSMGLGPIKVAFWIRPFADGSVEADVQLNDEPLELFHGKTFSELASRLNAAARDRGYPESQFLVGEDGSIRIGGASITLGNVLRSTVPDWGIWVEQANPVDRLTPAAAWGGWMVRARSLSGRAYARGIQIRDIILEVDGKRCPDLEALRSALREAKSIKVLRADYKEVVLNPGS